VWNICRTWIIATPTDSLATLSLRFYFSYSCSTPWKKQEFCKINVSQTISIYTSSDMFDKLMETLYEKRRETIRWFGSSIKYIGWTSELLTQRSRWIGLNGPNLDHEFYIIFFSARRKDHVILIIIQPNWQIAHTSDQFKMVHQAILYTKYSRTGRKQGGAKSLLYHSDICMANVYYWIIHLHVLYMPTLQYTIWVCHFRVP
jgi:hypothetical protein